jgi:predicted secreted protein
MMKTSVLFPSLLAAGLALASWPLQAQDLRHVDPHNQVQLSASASLDVPQDWLTMSLSTTRDGADAQLVQAQLRQALDSALAEAKKAAQPGQLEVRTGNFSISPRYTRDGKISAWVGSTELVLEGRDFARISATAGRLATLTMGYVAFSLSREARAKVEGDTQAQAIERFKAKAGEIAKGFGFAGYTLGQVTVAANDQPPVPRPRMMAMRAEASPAPMPDIPVEAGKATVTTTVSGSVLLK